MTSLKENLSRSKYNKNSSADLRTSSVKICVKLGRFHLHFYLKAKQNRPFIVLFYNESSRI